MRGIEGAENLGGQRELLIDAVQVQPKGLTKNYETFDFNGTK